MPLHSTVLSWLAAGTSKAMEKSSEQVMVDSPSKDLDFIVHRDAEMPVRKFNATSAGVCSTHHRIEASNFMGESPHRLLIESTYLLSRRRVDSTTQRRTNFGARDNLSMVLKLAPITLPPAHFVGAPAISIAIRCYELKLKRPPQKQCFSLIDNALRRSRP